VAQSDMINSGNMDLITGEWGLPPVSREGLMTCDEYSDNYQEPCTASGRYIYLC
jgi:hypothetical protein